MFAAWVAFAVGEVAVLGGVDEPEEQGGDDGDRDIGGSSPGGDRDFHDGRVAGGLGVVKI